MTLRCATLLDPATIEARRTACSRCAREGILVDTAVGDIIEGGVCVDVVAATTADLLMAGRDGRPVCRDCSLETDR